MTKFAESRNVHDFPCWCGATEADNFCSQMFGRHHFLVLRCTGCGTQRILPRALNQQDSAETLYNEYAGTEVFDIDQKTIFEVMRKRFSEVALAFPRGCRVLDVGCGSGLLLDAICQHFDCEGKGIDVDRRGIAAGKAHAKRATFECGLFDPARLETTYDVILSTAVVEHVLDPVGFLKQLTHGLSKGGSIFLSTPNASSLNYWLLRSWWRELLSIGEHIYLFTPESLNACAQKAGLQLVSASSGFDYGPFRFQLDSARNAVITIWALYRLLVKHLSICFASRLTGDILFAHYKMAKI